MAKRIRIKIIPLIILFVAVAYAVVTGIRMATLDTTVSSITTYQIPSFPALVDLPVSTYGQQAVAIDGSLLYEKNNLSEKTQPIASTVKMVLGLAVMEKKPFDLSTKGGTITISAEDYNDYSWYNTNNGSTTPVVIGENYSEYDALSLVFLASSNNMADTLARWAFGSQSEYQTYATEMLKKIGIEDIVIGADASGYNTSTVGSANSLALLSQKVMEQPVLAEIVGTKDYNAENVGVVSNTNKLLGIDGINGVKTGYNGAYSGYCLVTSFPVEDTAKHNVTVALLGAPSREESFADSQSIIEKTQSILTPSRVIKEGDVVGYYDSWWDEKTTIVAQEDMDLLGWDGVETNVTLVMNGDNGELRLTAGEESKTIRVKTSTPLKTSPNMWERFIRTWGWEK